MMLKKELRELYKKKRTMLSAHEIEESSEQIRILLLQLLSKLKFKHINCFLTSKDKLEIHTSSIIEDLWKKAVEVSIPYSDYQNLSIKAAEYSQETELELDAFGIPQAKNPYFAPLNSIDIVIVPLLCFNEKGYRVGYGKGMYDRFLSQCRADVIRVGLSPFEVAEENWEIDKYDIPLHYVVSPEEIYTFS